MTTTEQNKVTDLPKQFTAVDGRTWVFTYPSTSKPWLYYEPGEDPQNKSSTKYHAATNEEAEQAYKKTRPPMFGMDGEKLNDLPDLDQEPAEEPKKRVKKTSGVGNNGKRFTKPECRIGTLSG